MIDWDQIENQGENLLLFLIFFSEKVEHSKKE